LQTHHILGCLATWREEDGIVKLVDSMLDGFGQEGLGHGGDDTKGENKKMSTNIKQCLRKVIDGHFTAIVKVLGVGIN
jgi:hypothetical protein